MSPTQDRLLALLRSGELAHAAKSAATRSAMAKNLGMTENAYEHAVKRLRRNGVKFPTFVELRTQVGHAPTQEGYEVDVSDFDEQPTNPGTHHPALPAGHFVKGVSTYFDEDGKVRGQWVKTNVSAQERMEALLAALPALAEDWRGKADPIDVPAHTSDELLTVLPIGDPHIGMFSWALETGADFDLKIAERNLFTAARHLIASGPASGTALVIPLGDTFHSDGKVNATTKGTRVDVDGRWPKVVSVGIRLMRSLIDLSLEKHDRVIFKALRGNHDDLTSLVLGMALAQFYEREPRVTIDTSPSKFFWHRFGVNLIGATHTETVKLADLPLIMACDRPTDWGETKYRRVYGGHRHHEDVKEYPGCTVDIQNTLAAADEWHSGQGYRAARNMKLDVWHARWGFTNRHIVGIEQIEAMQ